MRMLRSIDENATFYLDGSCWLDIAFGKIVYSVNWMLRSALSFVVVWGGGGGGLGGVVVEES